MPKAAKTVNVVAVKKAILWILQTETMRLSLLPFILVINDVALHALMMNFIRLLGF